MEQLLVGADIHSAAPTNAANTIRETMSGGNNKQKNTSQEYATQQGSPIPVKSFTGI